MRLIDADALKNHIESYYDKFIFVSAVKCLIDNSPTIEAEPVKHGRWISEKVINLYNGEKRNARECSECGATYFVYDVANVVDEIPHYCPNCGAIMDEVEP